MLFDGFKLVSHKEFATGPAEGVDFVVSFIKTDGDQSQRYILNLTKQYKLTFYAKGSIYQVKENERLTEDFFNETELNELMGLILDTPFKGILEAVEQYHLYKKSMATS